MAHSINAENSYKSESNFAEESSVVEAIQAPEARFECPICLAWLRDPMQTTCGHRFCRTCIESWLEREKACPVDNMKLERATDIFADEFTRREISQQRTRCPYLTRGCTEELSPLDVEMHISLCKFKPPQLPDNEKLRCTFVGVGCEEKFEDDPELQRHVEQQIQKHLMLLSHACSKFSVSTTLPGTSASALAQQANFWDPPTKSDNRSIPYSSTDDLVKSLYEKIVILEQKTREQDIIIANMSQHISSMNLAMSKLPLRYCNGSYIWYVHDFKNKINQMKNNHHIVHYSPGFYTSPNGYKICLRLNLSPKDQSYLAILTHMMKTEHDNSLDWPFSGRICIILIHPKLQYKNIKETMMTRPELEAFKKPVDDLNPKGFGYTEFVLVEDLFLHDFVDGNQLIIKVTVQAV